MSYAVRKDGLGFRAVGGPEEINVLTEDYSVDLPTINISTPLSCNAYQLRRALSEKGWRQDIEAAVAAAGQEIQDAYSYWPTFSENNPLVLQIAQATNKTSEEVHDLFSLAITLVPGQ